jgi:hypothetical protein
MVRRVRPGMVGAVASAAVALTWAPPPASAVLVYERRDGKYDEARHDIVAARGDGSKPRVIAHGYAPSVSPDGKLVAYYVEQRLHVKPIDGGRRRLLTRVAYDDGERIPWSADSRHLVTGRVPNSGAYLIDVPARTKRLTSTGDFAGASFAPAGAHVVLDRTFYCDTCSDMLLVLDAHTLQRQQRVPGWHPRWGARGLAFARNNKIMLLPSVGGKPHTLFRAEREVLVPIDWSADGGRLLVESSETFPTSTFRAIVARADTGARAEVPYDFKWVQGLSAGGRRVLGESPAGHVVSVGLDGTERVLARHARRPSWTK